GIILLTWRQQATRFHRNDACCSAFVKKWRCDGSDFLQKKRSPIGAPASGPAQQRRRKRCTLRYIRPAGPEAGAPKKRRSPKRTAPVKIRSSYYFLASSRLASQSRDIGALPSPRSTSTLPLMLSPEILPVYLETNLPACVSRVTEKLRSSPMTLASSIF